MTALDDHQKRRFARPMASGAQGTTSGARERPLVHRRYSNEADPAAPAAAAALVLRTTSDSAPIRRIEHDRRIRSLASTGVRVRHYGDMAFARRLRAIVSAMRHARFPNPPRTKARDAGLLHRRRTPRRRHDARSRSASPRQFRRAYGSIRRGRPSAIARRTSSDVPPLGCGNGGLDWVDVRPRIESALTRALRRAGARLRAGGPLNVDGTQPANKRTFQDSAAQISRSRSGTTSVRHIRAPSRKVLVNGRCRPALGRRATRRRRLRGVLPPP